MKKGFTLIELLVVVSIIGLLASIVVVSLGGARRGGRDAKAMAELRQIQTALELCYNEAPPGAYPNFAGSDDTWVDIVAWTPITCADQTFMDPVPTTAGVNPYQWNDYNDPQKYGLRVNLEQSGCFTVTDVGLIETDSACL